MPLTYFQPSQVDSTFNGYLRNRIINGAMMIDQRNAGAAVTANGAFPVDRFFYAATQASKATLQQNAGGVTPPQGFTKYFGVTSSSAYAVLASDYFNVRQVIEGFNISDFNYGTAYAKTITLSFWVRSSLTGNFGGVLAWGSSSANQRSYPFLYTITGANTWEYKTVTVPGDTTMAAGGFETSNGAGMQVRFSLGGGATNAGTPGSWATVNAQTASGDTSVVGTNGATWYLTGVQLEVGSVATPFERRLYPQELAMCQRYYEKSYDYGTAPGTAGAVTTNGSMKATQTAAPYQSTWQVQFKVTKRTAPTFTVYNPVTGGSGTCRDDSGNNDAIGTTSIGESNAMPFDTSGSSVGFNHYIQWAASAEL